MNLERIKFQTCPNDQEEGILLTDLEETSPETDNDGNLQYYCPNCHQTFSYCECNSNDSSSSYKNRKYSYR